MACYFFSSQYVINRLKISRILFYELQSNKRDPHTFNLLRLVSKVFVCLFVFFGLFVIDFLSCLLGRRREADGFDASTDDGSSQKTRTSSKPG